MDQIIFYNIEKNNVRLSIQGGTSYENAINMCNEFIGKLNEQMAAEIARQELALSKSNESSIQQVDIPEEAGSDGSN